jgi:hypothetical protein
MMSDSPRALVGWGHRSNYGTKIAADLGTSEVTLHEQRGHVMQEMETGPWPIWSGAAMPLGISPSGHGRSLPG